MDAQARQKYLTSQVMTAPPEKLRLMLIDAAIRNINVVIEHWDDEDRGTVWESGSKAQEIVTELISGINREANPELAEKILAIYAFIFRQLVEGLSKQDLPMLEDAIRILETERETWQQVCLQLSAEREPQAKVQEQASETDVVAPPVGLDGQAGSLPGAVPPIPGAVPPMTGVVPPMLSPYGTTGGQTTGFSAEG